MLFRSVGYGDISPSTSLGQAFAAVVMILGYGIIAVPTGIVSVEIASATKKQITTQVCPSCLSEGHDNDAVHCKFCGAKLYNKINLLRIFLIKLKNTFAHIFRL